MRRIFFILILATILIVAGCAARPDAAEASSPATRPTLTVGTYNLRWLADADRLRADFVALAHVDVWCLQELRLGHDDAAATTHIRSLFPPGDWSIRFIRVNRLREIGSDDWEGQAIVSRVPIIAETVWPLDERSFKRRVALAAMIDAPGGPLRVVVTDHSPSYFAWGDANARQLRELTRRLAATTGPAVVAGDFNAAGNLVRGYGNAAHVSRVDASLAAIDFRAADARGATFRAGWIVVRIDRIYVRGLEVERASVAAEARGSDHRPVWATLR